MTYFSIVQEFEDKLQALIDLLNQTEWYPDTTDNIDRTKQELVEMFQQQVDTNEDISDTVLELHQLINGLEDQIKDKDQEIHDLHKELDYWVSAEE